MSVSENDWNFKTGDLLVTTKELLVRNDGFTFDESDADEEGKISKDWLRDADVLEEGVYCTFLRLGEEDDSYALVRRDLLGRAMMIRCGYLEVVSKIDDAV